MGRTSPTARGAVQHHGLPLVVSAPRDGCLFYALVWITLTQQLHALVCGDRRLRVAPTIIGVFRGTWYLVREEGQLLRDFFEP